MLTRVLVLLTLAAPAAAQDPAPAGGAKPPPKVDGGAKPAPPPVAPGRKADVEIKVLLKNGNLITGYALEGMLVEKPIQLTATTDEQGKVKRQDAYVPAKPTDEGAGIRIWYPNNVRGYQFVPYTQIGKVDVGRTLTPEEQKALFEGIIEKERALALAGLQIRKEAEEREKAASDARRVMVEDAIARRKGVSVDDDRKRRAALLAKFPPKDGADGWNADRRATIERKLAVLGVPPSAQEKEFLSQYGDWVKAVAESKEIGPAPTPSGGGTPPAGETPPAAEKPPATQKPPAGEKPPSGETPPAGGSAGP